ncbi:DEAD/DEAH box helicase [Micromonospora aurantiaca]|uniref:DEAD/DEAH box helicase n=1 Tax=Micromonospora aurantiaca (nom. illeg.) TaxID=47850 RepID=A0ABQ6UMJ4_9ACTN|nr:DEAD/DEAH box helicase [Micromonospora aurantiaca]KAB1118474.1 DEAD/DEAH box helicase [Micromonospora aurantiaca]
MAFDFSKLSAGGTIGRITDPARLFDALPDKADGYGYLRAVQKDVLDAWSARRTERDIVVKTNTGGGKTIVGLLMLQCCLNERTGPALYLSPTPDLAKRVRAEARNLGIATVDDPASSKFLRGEAICVTTMNVLINGKTRFGLTVPGSRHQPVMVGAVVVDDAHAALAMTEENTRLRIPRDHSAYVPLLELFEDDLRAQSPHQFLDIQDQDPSAVLAVPFWAWQDKQEGVLQILHPERSSPAFEWSWPLISDILPWCQAVVTADDIEIMPPCPPIEKIPSFAQARRRIYLTATLADDSVLVTHFDADKDSIATSIFPDSAADLGDRLILAPEELNPDISHDDVRAMAASIAQNCNVVVLVPSKRQAALWTSEATLIVSKADDISGAVERLTAGHVGLVVIINRYDGIDLPDEACRLLIIDNLPLAYGGFERREALALRDTEAMVTRQLQRLEQGMGRGVRSRDDRCAILLLGPRLTQLLARPEIADRLSEATRAQLELSRQVARDLEGTDLTGLRAVITQVINDDRGFRLASREALIGVTYSPASVSATATHLRAAYNSAIGHRASDAAEQAKAAVDAARDGGDAPLAGWLGETHAAYLNAVDTVAAQQALTEAALLNNAVLRPRAGLEYRRISPPSPQAHQASAYLVDKYATGHDLIVGLDALMDDIDWDRTRTDAAEAALADLGAHLGFSAQQPERHFGIGSDVLWAAGNRTYVVIEAKTGAQAPRIWKKDINQLSGSVNWCQREYGSDAMVIPVLVHPTHVVEHSGTPPRDTRIISEPKLKALKHAIRRFARAIALDDKYRTPGAVEPQLAALDLSASALITTYTQLAYREPASA